MMDASTRRGDQRRRGGVLLVIVFSCALLSSAAGLFFYNVSHTVGEETRVRDNQSTAQDHAAFAASLIASRLGDVDYGSVAAETGNDYKTVVNDWVASAPYAETGDGRFERRIAGRIGGETDGYDYTAKAVAIREARSAEESPSWQAGMDVPDYEYGKDPARKFNASYEITATARSVAAGASPEMAAEGQVQTVVSLTGESAYNDLDKLATYHAEIPPTQIAAEENHESEAPAVPENAPGGSQNFKVSGEDHYSIRTVAQAGIIDQVVEGLLRIQALSTEFFSIYNNWWDYGKQTVQFMVGDTPNPHIPRTREISSANIDRQMISQDPNREPDIYFSGGKQGRSDANVDRFYTSSGWVSRWYRGRTVNIGEDGLIRETTDAQANPTTGGLRNQKSLAVGSPEDFMKLYFNYVEPFNNTAWPSNTASAATLDAWKGTWRQVMFANYPRNATIILPPYTPDRNSNYAWPRDNWQSARRRRFPLLIMPMNADGAMLVREYDNAKGQYGNRYEQIDGGSQTPQSKWNGTYTWMYRLGITNVAYTSIRGYNGVWGKPTAQNPTSRMQEKAMAPRKLSLSEFIGYSFTTDNKGVPAKIENGQVVAGVPDFKLDAQGGRIPYYPEVDSQGRTIEGNNFNESWQRDTSEGDNWGVDSTTLPLMPPTDGIYVRLKPTDEEYTSKFRNAVPDEGYWQAPAARNGNDGIVRRYKRYQTLKDFAFPRNVGTEEEPDMRDVSSVFLSFDTNQENDATYFYYLLELSASIVWPKRTIVAGDDPSERFRHWWEGDSQEGLTGGAPTRSMSAPAGADIMALPPEDRLQALLDTYDLFRPDGDDHTTVNNMLDSGGAMAGFNKVTFDTAEGNIGGVKRLSPWNDESPIYYYGGDELWGVASALYKRDGLDSFTAEQLAVLASLKENGDVGEYNDKWEEFLKERALAAVLSRKAPGVTYLPYSSRFSPESGRVQAILSKNAGGRPNPYLDAVLGIQNTVTGRSLSSMTFGGRKFRAPAVYAKDDGGSLSRMSPGDFGMVGSGDMPPTAAMVELLPGELNPANGAEFIENRERDLEASPEIYPWVEMLARSNGAVQLNGRPIQPKFIWLDNPPQTASSGVRDTGMAGIRTPPDWFTERDPETGVVLHDVLLKGDARLKMGGNHREHRGAIGWHREGQGSLPPVFYDEPDLGGEEGYNSTRKAIHKKIFGDHFEYVVLSSREEPARGSEPAGFFPFVTMNTPNAQGRYGRHLALFRPGDEDPLTMPDPDTFVPRLRSAGGMPTFVIEGKELDGAGIMVVNGNLHIKTRFAYHGLLIVLGDILVEPTYHERYDNLGNRLDADNEAIKSENGVWYVINPHTREIRRDSEGVAVKSSGPASEWLGSLVVQGKVVVGGKSTFTPAIASNAGEPLRPAGVIDVRASTKAVEDAMGTWIKVGPNEGIVARQHAFGTGSTISDIVIDGE